MRRDRSVLLVMAKRCAQCLYSDNKIVSDARRDQLLADCAKTERGFTCHKATHARMDAMCRAHWDATKNVTLRNRLAQRLKVVRFVELSE
jgi:hypothetical protein